MATEVEDGGRLESILMPVDTDCPGWQSLSRDADPSSVVAVFSRLSIATDCLSDTDVVREVVLLSREGLLRHVLLACALIDASRRSLCGPAIAYGLWAHSVLIRRSGGTVSNCWEQDCDSTGQPAQHAEFVEWLERHEAGLPVLLLPLEPRPALTEIAQLGFPDLQLSCESVGPQCFEFSATPVLNSGGALPLEGCSGESNALGTRITVSAHVSPLCRSIVVARAAEIDVEDCSIDVGGAEPDGAAPDVSMHPQWVEVLPEIAPRFRETIARAASSHSLAAGWLRSLGGVPSAQQAAAMSTRANLVWLLARITARCPIAGYLGLLATTPEHAWDHIITCARLAGVHVIDPSPGFAGGSWKIDLLDDHFAITSFPESNGLEQLSIIREDLEGGDTSPTITAPTGHTNHLIVEGEPKPARRLLKVGDMSLSVHLESGPDHPSIVVQPAPNLSTAFDVDGTDTESHGAIGVEVGAWHVRVDARLQRHATPKTVDVRVLLTGDRAADLRRIAQLNGVLDRYPGPCAVRVVLWRASFRKVIERGGAKGVTLGAELQSEVESLIGPGSVTISEAATE
jgi:hypothetical protein